MGEFVDASEPMIALAGALLPPEMLDSKSPVQVLVADGEVRDYPEELLPLLKFLSEPRSETEVIQRLKEDGAPSQALNDLIKGQHVICIQPGESIAALEGFSGLRVVASGVPVPSLSGDGLVYIGTESDDVGTSLPVAELLAMILWEEPVGEDFPTAALRHAKDLRVETSRIGRDALFGLGALLGSGLARLEWTKGE